MNQEYVNKYLRPGMVAAILRSGDKHAISGEIIDVDDKKRTVNICTKLGNSFNFVSWDDVLWVRIPDGHTKKPWPRSVYKAFKGIGLDTVRQDVLRHRKEW